jgi:RNA polymerase sigma factor (TIGR02999 family)
MDWGMSLLPADGSISRLLAQFRIGDKQATNELVELFYPELRRLANVQMRRERQGHSWQPTLLVNELYLQLIKIKALPSPADDVQNERSAFFGFAAHLMRRLLIHHARPLRAKAAHEGLTETTQVEGLNSVAEIETALTRLEQIRPRLRAVVELKVFEEMTLEEVAASLSCSTATVTREWHFARHWLQTELGVRAGADCGSVF